MCWETWEGAAFACHSWPLTTEVSCLELGLPWWCPKEVKIHGCQQDLERGEQGAGEAGGPQLCFRVLGAGC